MRGPEPTGPADRKRLAVWLDSIRPIRDDCRVTVVDEKSRVVDPEGTSKRLDQLATMVEELGDRLEDAAGMRNVLVHGYLDVD
jgi:uncharacterized protein YutE (UPF0331/DUF86 family)